MNVESLMQQGVTAFSRNDYARALNRFAEVLRANPRHIPALIHSGVALGIGGRFAEALGCFDRVLKIDPNHGGALDCRGRALANLGRYEEAQECYGRILALQPRHPDALFNRGLALEKLGRAAEALECFERLLALQPLHAAALNSRGVALGNLQRGDEALQCFDRALALNPAFAEALLNRGNALLELQRDAEALESFERAATLQPGNNDVQFGRGNALARLERYEDALACFSAILLKDSEHTAARFRRGVALSLLLRFEEALTCFDQVLARQPEHFDALINRGMMCAKLGRLDQALENYDQILRIDPLHVNTIARRGGVMESYGRDAEALECFAQALALDPQHVDARNNRSLLLLARGELQAGFREQEVRWEMDTYKKSRAPTAAPLWLGETPLQGRTLLVWAEQGLGDNIQFLRYVPLLARRGARVVLRTRAPLRRLLRTLEGVAEMATDEEPLPQHDLQCPVMSLPLALGTTLETIPAEIPYLGAEPALAAAWEERLGGAEPGRRPRIGLVWAGRQYGQIMYARDMKLESLRPVLELDAQFVSLQKEIPDADLGLLAALPQVARHGETLADFADTAALIACLDLVISVDTSIAHLAGALGKPVWIMNRHSPCWRWLRGRTDSPWYPTARLFQQPAHGDWPGMVAQVRQALEAEFALPPAAQPLPAAEAVAAAQHTGQDRVAALIDDARAALERDDLPLSLHLFGRALLLAPSHLGALNHAGCILARQGRYEDALQTFARAAEIDPRHVGSLSNRAGALLSLGRNDEALRSCDSLLQIDPHHADGLVNRAVALFRLGRPEAALADCERALAAAAGHRGALNTLGLALTELGRHEEAAAAFGAILAAEPRNLDAHLNLGVTLGKLERTDQAIDSFRKVLESNPDHPGALAGLGYMLCKQRRFAEALPVLEQAIRQEPRGIEALGNRAFALIELERFDEAERCLEQILDFAPGNTDALFNLGVISNNRGQLQGALAYYDRALALDPGHGDAQCNRGTALLAQGRLAEGFAAFEHRWNSTQLRHLRMRTEAPLWLGQEPLEGKILVVLHEQGLGDTVQFCRYTRLAAQRAARVILRVPAPLVRLLRSLRADNLSVVADSEPVPPHDYHCPLMSLPLAFGTTLETVPAEIPYLEADPALVRRWQERLGARGSRPRIGLVWAGRQQQPVNYARDMKLQFLLPLLALDAEFVSLQKEVPEADLELLKTLPQIARHGEAVTDFADTAALIENLDLVIAVDTSVAHVAGALGKPVWIMNRYASCWRWLRERTDSPWYPTVRLFRQPAYGDWSSAVAELARAVADELNRDQADPDALMREGLAHAAAGRHQEAVASFCKLLEADPLQVDALNNLGATLVQLGRHAEALACFGQALAMQPDHAQALANRGGALIGAHREEEALESLDRALALQPDLRDAQSNRGLALLRLHRVEEALRCHEQVLALDPHDVAALNGRGVALERLGRPDEALACYERALALQPDHVDVRLNRSFVLLAQGELAAGFREQEVRWRTALATTRPDGVGPLWLGDAPLQGKTLLLLHEQGLGDTIQFSRYAILAAESGARVILRAPAPLANLLRGLESERLTVIGEAEATPPHDLHCPLMSLPLAFGTTLETIPARVPYLRADAARVEHWKKALGPRGGRPRIGLVWAGRQYPPINYARDMKLEFLLPLLRLDAEFVSLQKEVPEADRAMLAALPQLACHGETLEDFADTAALIENLDLLLTVDTSVAHVAGALGKPVWIMNRHSPCWRWLRGRTDSPWYPTARLFGQPTYGDWGSVVAAVREELRRMR